MKDPIELNVIDTIDSIAKLVAFFFPNAGAKIGRFVSKMREATPLWAAVTGNLAKLGTALSLLGLALNGAKPMGAHWNWACGALALFGVFVSIYTKSITPKEDKKPVPSIDEVK